MILEDLLKIPAEERDKRLASFMESKPDNPENCKSLHEWNRDDRATGTATCYDFESPCGWWRLSVDFGNRDWNHVPEWQPRFTFADGALADEGDLLVASFEIIKRLREMGWLVDIKTMNDGFVVQAKNWHQNKFEQVPCDNVHEGVSAVALLVEEEPA